MNRLTVLLCTLSLGTVAPPASVAQAPGQEPSAVEAPAKEEERFGNVEGLPSWLRLGVELRGRAEFKVDSEQALEDRVYLNRLRLNATVQPARWVRFLFEGQDARAFRLNPGPAPEGRRNVFDVRQGYLELGNSEQGFQARVGRQELSLGDERLVGADNYWDPFGLAFDAARLSFAGERFRVEAFTGFLVEPADRRPDRWDRTSRLSGISAQFKTGAGEGLIEPYLLWKLGGDTLDLMGHPGHRDVVTPGVRAQGDLPRSLDYNIEMAFQGGHVVRDHIAAWGGHWEVGWKPLGRDLGPRLGFEYNFASGDADPEDGKHATFDDLYPAGFNAYGITDPFAWRNIRYPGGDEYQVRHPGATSSHIGSQVFFSAGYDHSRRWRVHAGYGHLFPGGYLRQSGCSSAVRTIYLLSGFTF